MNKIIMEKRAQKFAWLLLQQVNDQIYFLITSEITKFEKVFGKVYRDLATLIEGCLRW